MGTRGALLALGLLAVWAPAASAATFNVNSTADTGDTAPGNGVCTAPSAGPPICTLRAAVEESNAFAPDDIINLPAGTYIVQNPSAAADFGDLRVTDSVTINGAGASSTIIDSQGLEGAFFFGGTLTVTLRDLQITGGSDSFGAAMQFQAGSLTLERVDINGNTEVAPSPVGVVVLAAGFGTANATIRDSTIRNNTVASGGDGVIAQQSAVNGDLTITGSTLSNNTLAGGTFAGGVIDFSPSSPAGGTLLVENSTFSQNSVGAPGDPGDGAAINIFPDDFSRGVATIRGSTFVSNRAQGGSGGAINTQFFTADSSLGVFDSSFVDNRASTGGALSPSGSGSATIERSTFANNVAGGGGAVSAGLPLTIANSTFTGNQAGGSGGAVRMSDTLTVGSATLSGNSAGGAGGGISTNDTVNVSNSIVSGNTAPGGGTNCAGGAFVSGGHNLEQGSSCGFGGAGDLNANPLLGPLGFYGGPTPTLPLLAGSPAIDANAGCLVTDQRGVARPVGPSCDIGAFETTVEPGGGGGGGGGSALPLPVLGQTFNVERVSGRVLIASASGPQLSGRAGAAQKGRTFVPLTDPRQLTVGSFLDTKKGRARITTATGVVGTTQQGEFFKGLFQVLQSRSVKAKGLTTMKLKGSSFRRCRAAAQGKRASVGEAIASARRKLSGKTVRRLGASANGRFRTRGRHSAATVRGTTWTTADRCDGTLTRVKRGKVAVRDFRRKKTIVVAAGKRYLAKAPLGG